MRDEGAISRMTERWASYTTPVRDATRPILEDVRRLDLAVYRAIATTSTPTLDEPMRRLSDAANHSKLWLVLAGIIGVFGGKTGRRAALTGIVAIGLNSAIVNIPIKLAGDRSRPDRDAAQVPEERRVTMPDSSSFPSGHTATGFAFSAAIAGTAPGIAWPARMLASVVGYSRVHTGVHYPGDVVVGALIGTTIGESVAFGARSWRRRHGGR
jgi:undecaprenyl-diphosphatase